MRTVPVPEPGRGPAAYQPALVRSTGVPSGAWPLASRRPDRSRPMRSKAASTPSAGTRRRCGSPTRHDDVRAGGVVGLVGAAEVLGRGAADVPVPVGFWATDGSPEPVGCGAPRAGSGHGETVGAATAGSPPGSGSRYQRP